jgi:hypothetical protein
MQRRADGQTPEVRRAWLAGIAALRARVSGRELERLIANGESQRIIELLFSDANIDGAFARFRASQQMVTRDAVAYFGKDIPGAARATVGVAFDVLNPRVVDAVRILDTTMMQTVKADVREVVRAAITKGLEDGVGPRTTARALREVLGLAPNQLEAVSNFEAALRGVDGAGNPLTRALRDKRFDATVKRGNLTEAQIQKMTDAYRRRMVAFNAETNARTATLDALKLGQELSWRDAIDKGILPEGAGLFKQWKGVMDDREREEHIAMEGETVPFDQPYSNGEMVPGESTYNCRCVSIIFARTGA